MAAPHRSFLDDAKQLARGRARALRARCDPALGAALARHVLRECPPPRGAVVGGFWPLAGEIDIRFLLHALHANGHAVALPETTPKGHPLVFRLWQPAAPLRRGRFGTLHPDGAAVAPDFLLVPLLGFDRRGHRLGHGGGYYDRTLAALPAAFALGCAFAAQELDAVPTGEHDIPLPAIATEFGVIRARPGPAGGTGP